MLISNTGPIIALAGISHLYLLRELYKRVIVPQAVDKEISSRGRVYVGEEV